VTHWYVCCDSLIRVLWLIDTCAVTHWYVCCDSLTRVLWLIDMRHVPCEYVCCDSLIRVSCDSLICVMWLIDMCHVTHLCDTTHETTHWYVWCDSLICVSCDSFVRHDSWNDSDVCRESLRCWLWKVLICVMWLICATRLTNRLRCVPWSIEVLTQEGIDAWYNLSHDSSRMSHDSRRMSHDSRRIMCCVEVLTMEGIDAWYMSHDSSRWLWKVLICVMWLICATQRMIWLESWLTRVCATQRMIWRESCGGHDTFICVT